MSDVPQKLSPEIGAALGVSSRKLVRVLATVVEAISAKLFVQSIVAQDTATTLAITEALAANQWELLERKIYRATSRDGVSYVLTSYTDKPVLHQLNVYDGRSGAYILYEDVNKSKPVLGLNTWYARDTRYLDLYYPDRIEKYIFSYNEGWLKRRDVEGETWPVDWTDNDNKPLGIPLIEFTLGESDLAHGAVQVQQDINEALVDQMAVSRTQGFPQRYYTGAGSLNYYTGLLGQPLLDATGKQPLVRTVKLTPGSIMPLQSGEELGQLDQADIDTGLVDKLLHILSLITTVPTFYFTGDFPSGIALIQAETRLNSKCEEHQSYLTQGLTDLFRFMLKLSNVYGKKNYNIEAPILITWYPPQVETEDLRLDKMTKTAQALVALDAIGGLSTETKVRLAFRLVRPGASDEDIDAEVERVLNAPLPVI